MKTYPYNRTSVEGRKLFRLLDNQYNPGVLETQVLDDDTNESRKQFEAFRKTAVMQCRANAVSFIIASNLAGIKRPSIHIEADVEMAWGEFTDTATTLDFTHGEELPLTFVQPLEDDTLKSLIDAGLYSDDRFEELMSKLISDEVFDVEAEMDFTYLDVGDAAVNQGATGSVPVILVDPVNVVHEDMVESEYTSVTNLVNRSAALVIELRKEGVKTDELVSTQHVEQDREVFIDSDFRDVIAERDTARASNERHTEFIETSDLLDQEIDVTEKLSGGLSFDGTSEDDRIRELKQRDRERAYDGDDSIGLPVFEDTAAIELEAAPSVFDFDLDDDNISDVTFDFNDVAVNDETEKRVSSDAFEGASLDDYKFEDEEEDELEL